MEDGSSSLPQLVEWLQSVGIWWDQSLVQIHGGCSNCSGPALGVFAESDIQENQLLCVIPRAAILSPRTTQLAQILEAEKLGGGLALTIALMYEASLGQRSKWAGYIASLPVREYLPMFWSVQELALLAGTALEGVAEDDRRETEEDYQAHVLPLMAKHKEAFPRPELCSLAHFRTAASWVASRSFHVDAWHGDAMVPLADIFNHKASLVLLEDGWQVAEEMDRQQQQQQQQHEHEDEQAASGEAADADDDDSDDGSNHGSNHGSDDDSDDDSDDEDADVDEDDPQHGFAVGGMPMIPSTAAAAAAGPAVAGIVHKAAGCWVRDGVNLRLEIGICSIGDSDTTLAGMADNAAAAAAGGDGHHKHDAHRGCNEHAEDGAKDTEAQQQQQQQQQQRRRKAAAETLAQQQQRKKQKTGQQQQQQEEEAEKQQQQQFPEKRLEIVAASPVAAGAEVHNTYGELSNQALVHKYGFCLPANPFDDVDLGPGWGWLLREVAAAGGLARKLKQHVAWLERNSHLLSPAADNGSADEDDSAGEASAEPPAVLPGGRLPSVVAAAVRLLGASSAQLKAWGSLQEVLQEEELEEQQQEQRQKVARKDSKQQQKGGSEAAEVVDAEVAAAAAAEKALAEHFDDVQITGRSVEWWGRAGLELLQAAVQQRLLRYPAKGLSIAADEKALQELRTQQQQQQQQEKGQKQPVQKQKQPKQQGGGSAGEHAAAVAAALQLRICEQRILKQTLDAIEQVLC